MPDFDENAEGMDGIGGEGGGEGCWEDGNDGGEW
jgi:hypothetical protein